MYVHVYEERACLRSRHCLGGPGCGSVGSSSVAFTNYRWQIFGGHESLLSMRRPYGGRALLTQLSYWVSSGGDLRLGTCAVLLPFTYRPSTCRVWSLWGLEGCWSRIPQDTGE